MDDTIAISVKDISKDFRLPHQKVTSIKSGIVHVFRKRNKKVDVQHALENVSFDIKKGEFFGIVGRNGSGKSTLLKIISGIYTPDKGAVRVNGSLVPFIELGVGFNPELSGRENVYLNGALLGFSKKQIDAMYNNIVEFAELEKFMDQKLKNYSSGMQVRLAFSVAIRAESDILVLDEVLAVGDAAFQQKCFDYFEEMRRSNKTVILVTHDMSAVKRFCERAVLIKNGKIEAVGSPENVADQYLLENIAVDNIEPQENIESGPVRNLSLSVTKGKKTFTLDDSLEFTLTYKLSEEFNPCLGFSIMKDGISVTEVNTKELTLDNALMKKHQIKYKLPLRSFNPGSYRIDIAIFRKENMQLITYQLKASEFIVEGADPTRGGILRAGGVWAKDSEG